MAAMLNWIANGTINGTRYDGVQVLVRQGTATISDMTGPVITRDGVTDVIMDDPLVATIKFSDGTQWDVSRSATKRGCGSCGG